MSERPEAESIRRGIVFTRNPDLGESLRSKVAHWPLDLSVHANWEDWKTLSGECRLILVDRATMPPVEISDASFRIILSGEGPDLLHALEECFFMRDSLVAAVGIDQLLYAKFRQYLQSVSTLKDPESAYPFFCSLLDRILIPGILEVTAGNQHRASQILGISRTTFRNKMKEIQIEEMRFKK